CKSPYRVYAHDVQHHSHVSPGRHMADDARAAQALSSGVTLSCVIPCLNEADNLRVLLPELKTLLSSLVASYEIIVVDDGSTDATPELMSESAAQDRSEEHTSELQSRENLVC